MREKFPALLAPRPLDRYLSKPARGGGGGAGGVAYRDRPGRPPGGSSHARFLLSKLQILRLSFLRVSNIESTLTKAIHIMPRNGDCSSQWVGRKTPQNPENVPPPRERGGGWTRAVLNEKNRCSWQFCKKTMCSSYVQPWLVAVGSWWLVIGGWWRLALVDRLRLVAVDGWRQLAVGGWWQVAANGSWQSVVGGSLGQSLRVVLGQKKKT